MLATLCTSLAIASPALNIQQSVSSQGNNIYSIFLDFGSLNGNINAFEVFIAPEQGKFLNVSESGFDTGDLAPFEPGDEATFTNFLITQPPSLGGLDFVVVGGYDENRDQFFYASGPLGEQIDVDGPIFLNNIMLLSGSSATGRIRLVDAGVVLGQLDFTLIPEPTTALLAIACVLIATTSLRR